MFGLTCVVGAFISASGGVCAESTVLSIEPATGKDSVTFSEISEAIRETEEDAPYAIRILNQDQNGMAYTVAKNVEDSKWNVFDSELFRNVTIESNNRGVGIHFTGVAPSVSSMV